MAMQCPIPLPGAKLCGTKGGHSHYKVTLVINDVPVRQGGCVAGEGGNIKLPPTSNGLCNGIQVGEVWLKCLNSIPPF